MMLLEIDDSRTVGDLQEKFSECFPGFKICFFENPHHWSGRSLPLSQIEPCTKLEEIRKKHDPGIMDIKSWDKTGDIEKSFTKLFGLYVQVYYYSNGKWVQTTESDDLSLKQLSVLAAGLQKTI